MIITNLPVSVEKRDEGILDVYIGDYIQGRIYYDKGKYWLNPFMNNAKEFSTIEDAVTEFLSQKGFIDAS